MLSCPSTFLALQVEVVVLVSAYVMASTVSSVFLFAVLLMVPPCPAICKSEGTRAPVPYRVGAIGCIVYVSVLFSCMLCVRAGAFCHFCT